MRVAEEAKGFIGSWSRLLMREAQDCMQIQNRDMGEFSLRGESLDHPTNYL